MPERLSSEKLARPQLKINSLSPDSHVAMSLWSEKADAELKTLVDTHGKNWDTISTLMSETRTARGCEARCEWSQQVKPTPLTNITFIGTKLMSGKVKPRASKAASAAPSSVLSDSGQEPEHEDVSLTSTSARYAGGVELLHDPVEVAPLPAEQPKSNKKRVSSVLKLTVAKLIRSPILRTFCRLTWRCQRNARLPRIAPRRVPRALTPSARQLTCTPPRRLPQLPRTTNQFS